MMTGTHDLRLVALSLLIAVLASYTALEIAGQVTVSQGRAHITWLLGGAIAMGMGIWSMHFVGMLAFHLPVPIEYYFPTVLLSMLAAVIASGVALQNVSRSVFNRGDLLGGGVFMGLAIASMHYIGMMAMHVQAVLQYNYLLVALSVVIAITASCVALWLAFVLRGKTSWDWQKLGSALMMGAAISGMHYTAMAASHFTPSPEFRPAPCYTLNISALATAIGITTLIILGSTLLISLFNQRLAVEVKTQEMLQTLVHHMHVGVLLVGPQGEIGLSNPMACELLGLEESQLLGKTALDLDWDVIHSDGTPFPNNTLPVPQAIQSACAVQNVVMGLYRPLTQDRVWLLVNAEPQLRGDGSVEQVICTFSDITERQRAESARQLALEELEIRVEERTSELKQAIGQLQGEIAERKQAESALQQSEARFRTLAQHEELLNRLATQIRNSLDLNTILETTVQQIRELLQIDSCLFLWHVSELSQPAWEVVKEAKSAVLPSKIGDYAASGVGPLGALLLDRKIFQVDDVKTLSEPLLKQFLLSLGYTCLLALPIQTRSGDIGAVICSHYSTPRAWSDSEVELLQAVILQLAIAIDQADLYAQAQKAALVAQTQAQQVEQTLHQLQNTQAQLIQSEKMSSLGQLVAGVAHEINNPVSFITGNLTYATQYIQDLLDFLSLYQQHYPQTVATIQQRAEAIDLEFLLEDLPKLVASMQMGADRINQIVLSLRNFSRLDEAEMKQVNLHEGIDNSILILQHRLKSNGRSAEIKIVKDYGDLPSVECYPGQLNQVFMNILSNAIDALEEKRVSENDSSPVIEICTKVSPPGYVAVRIADNGSGMTEAVKARLFDPFFTTKPAGTGTGLGLSISYQIVVEKHKGVLKCLSAPGFGAEFWIEIPCQVE